MYKRMMSDSTKNNTEKTTVPKRKTKGFRHWTQYTQSYEYQNLPIKNDIISEEELAKHNKEDDMWIALPFNGKLTVFNITKFMEYHPGGYEVLADSAGRDATEDFRIAHAYVNINTISRLQVGYLQVGSKRHMPNQLSPFMMPSNPALTSFQAQNKSIPRWDWEDSPNFLTLKIDVKRKLQVNVNQVCVIVKESNCLHVRIFQDLEYYLLEIALLKDLTPVLESLSCSQDKRSVTLKLNKATANKTFSTLGAVKADEYISFEALYDNLPYVSATVLSNKPINHDSFIMEIDLPASCRLTYPLGHHLNIEAHINGESVTRPYTPVYPSLLMDKETPHSKLYLLYKVYPDGQMTNYLKDLSPKSKLNISPSVGRMNWSVLSGRVTVLMLVAGTGITAVHKIIHEILHKRVTIKNVNLLYFNKTENDILLREELSQLEGKYKSRFHVTHILSSAPDTWSGPKGRISALMLKEILPDLPDTASKQDRVNLICGPLPFNKSAVDILRNYGCHEKIIFEFKG